MRRVVITGVGVITPNGNSFDCFSDSLQKGLSGLDEVPAFKKAGFPCYIGGQVKHLQDTTLQKKFPTMSAVNDRKVCLGLQAFLEVSKYLPDNYNPCAIHLGTSLETFLLEKVFRMSPYEFNMDTYINNIQEHGENPYIEAPLDFLGNLISTALSLKGPNYLNCSACAASTQAIGHSFHMIRDGRYNMMICGGFDSMLNPLGIGGFSRLGALNMENDLKQKAICPFDIRRQGTILGEGAAIFILEEHEHALRHNRQIFAEISGYASTFDAFKLSEPDRGGKGIYAAMKQALSDAHLSNDTIDYINAHGTGTPTNDKVETIAIKNLFGQKAYSIPVSATKSMIGHLIGASGAVEIAAILAMFRDHFIAPTINLDKPDPECDLDYVPLTARMTTVNTVLKNSMGFGGQNASIVLKRYDPNPV